VREARAKLVPAAGPSSRSRGRPVIIRPRQAPGPHFPFNPVARLCQSTIHHRQDPMWAAPILLRHPRLHALAPPIGSRSTTTTRDACIDTASGGRGGRGGRARPPRLIPQDRARSIQTPFVSLPRTLTPRVFASVHCKTSLFARSSPPPGRYARAWAGRAFCAPVARDVRIIGWIRGGCRPITFPHPASLYIPSPALLSLAIYRLASDARCQSRD